MEGNRTTVYDISVSGFDVWEFLVIGGFVVLLAILDYKFPFIPYTSPPFAQRAMRWFVLLIVLLVFVLGTANLVYSYATTMSAVREGRIKVVEGVVSRFRAATFNDEFCVDEVCFMYPASFSSVGFRQLSSRGGHVHDGVSVRVSYVGGIITRLEILK